MIQDLIKIQQDVLALEQLFNGNPANQLTSNQPHDGSHQILHREAENGTYDRNKFPPHACGYCGIHDKSNVVKCLQCGKWFCNNKHENQNASDIVIHLLKSKHGKIGLFDKKGKNVNPIQCQDCKKPQTDVFRLCSAYSPTKNEDGIYCIDYAANDKKLGIQYWSLLIQEKRLLPRLVASSSEETLKKSKPLTLGQFNVQQNLDEETKNDTYDKDKLPPHACSYCGIHDKSNVVKCLECEKWFCNNKHEKQNASDIVLHLLKSKHGKIGIFNSEGKKINSIQCQDCKKPQTDVFRLCSAKSSKKSDYGIYCTDYAANDEDSGIEYWSALIQEKRLLTRLVPLSSEEALKKCKPLKLGQVDVQESLWRKGGAQLDPELQPQTQLLDKIQISYDSVQEYVDLFLPLIDAEAKAEKLEKGKWGQDNVLIDWNEKKRKDYQENVPIEFERRKRRFYAYLQCENEKYFDGCLRQADRLEIVSGKWRVEGIIKFVNDEEVCLSLPTDSNPPRQTTKVDVRYIWMGYTYEIMTKAVRSLPSAKTPKILLNYILNPPKLSVVVEGSNDPQIVPIDPKEYYKKSFSKVDEKRFKPDLYDLELAGIPKLNKSQLEAIKLAFSDWPVVAIQGPPGTGKTVTLTAILYILFRSISKKTKILFCAPSNVAVDHLARKLLKLNVKFLRIYSKSRETVEEAVDPTIAHLTMHEKIRKLADQQPKFKRLLELKEDHVWLSKEEEKEYLKFMTEAEEQFINDAKIICCTCITAGSYRLDQFRFEYVAIDEAAQGFEPETLVPIIRNAKKVFLVGDHKQLGPIVVSRKAKGANFGQTLFQRLALCVKPYRLGVQYRMHPKIAAFPSKWFYEDQLETAKEIQRPIKTDFPWPDKTEPRFFYNVEGAEEIPPSRISLMNRKEADFVKRVVNRITGLGIKADQVGVITPYKGQKFYLMQMQKTGAIPNGVEIDSVDGFQGREKDYIIISCVRSNQELGIGFLMDERRLNVALTRAKYGLIICGNAKLLALNTIWRELIVDYMQKGLLVEGNLGGNLTPIKIDVKPKEEPLKSEQPSK